jgi:hypothetical protein
MRTMLLVVALGVVLAGCAAATPETAGPGTVGPPTVEPATVPPSHAAPTPSPLGSQTGPLPLRAGALPAGTYTTTLFEPTVTFTIEDGWASMFPDDEDEVALEGPGSIFTIGRVAQVVAPSSGSAVAAPDDLVEWFTTHPGLTAEPPQAVTISGEAGRRVDVTVTSGSELGIFAYPTGNLRIPEGFTYRCHILELEGPDMAIIIGAPTASFAATAAAFESVLDSLVVESGG